MTCSSRSFIQPATATNTNRKGSGLSTSRWFIIASTDVRRRTACDSSRPSFRAIRDNKKGRPMAALEDLEASVVRELLKAPA